MLWRPQSNLPGPCTWSYSCYVVPVLCLLNWGLRLDFLKMLALKLSCSIVFPFPTPNAKAGLLTRSLMPFCEFLCECWKLLWKEHSESAYFKEGERCMFFISPEEVFGKNSMRFFFFLPSKDIAHKKRTVQLILGIYPEVQSLRKPPLSWKHKSLVT